jgi:hypothetical protein
VTARRGRGCEKPFQWKQLMTNHHLNSAREAAADAQVHIDHSKALGRAVDLAIASILGASERGFSRLSFGACKSDAELIRSLVKIQADQLELAARFAEQAEISADALQSVLHPPLQQQRAA